MQLNAGAPASLARMWLSPGLCAATGLAVEIVLSAPAATTGASLLVLLARFLLESLGVLPSLKKHYVTSF